jgi:hypothetical protein
MSSVPWWRSSCEDDEPYERDTGNDVTDVSDQTHQLLQQEQEHGGFEDSWWCDDTDNDAHNNLQSSYESSVRGCCPKGALTNKYFFVLGFAVLCPTLSPSIR